MRIHDIAFYAAGFFILGIFCASSGLNSAIIATAAVLTAALFLFAAYFKKKPAIFWIAGLCLFIIIGGFYYFYRNNLQIKNINIVFNEKISFQGLVVENPERGDQQKLVIDLKTPYQSTQNIECSTEHKKNFLCSGSGKVLIKLKPYPSFDYGDVINFEGTIKNPNLASSTNYADYLAKSGIFGTSDYPKAELIAENRGSKIKSALFKFKEKIVSGFQKVLPPEQSAFVAGLTIGERAEFSKDFKEAMSKSGTTHLVALSGYNISIIVLAVSGLFISFLNRRPTFILTILVIIGFVLMTGAEASVVRAAIMGFIALLAQQISRTHSIRNAVVLTAFLMVLINPRILRFDVGFQLSFMALLGLVCLSPAIKKFFRFKEDEGFMSWRSNLSQTISAQLAVAPILILNFGQFSLVSLLANVLILGVIPLTMCLGFILAGIGFISYYFSLVFGWFVNLFLSYEIFIIKLFGKLSVFKIDSLSMPLVIIYYLFLVGFILWNSRRLATDKNLNEPR